jgi:hypothetical protein
MSKIIDVLDFKPDSFDIAPEEEWRIMSAGNALRTKTQPRFCWPNCSLYIRDKDEKCGIFYECDSWVFDMHKIEKDTTVYLIMFATESDPPYDALGWWVSEDYAIKTWGQKRVNDMLADFNALNKPITKGIVIE